MNKLRMALAGCLATTFCVAAAHAEPPTDLQDNPGLFRVTDRVVNADVGAFTFTAPSFGNSLRRTGKGGFEPGTFRNRFVAEADSPDRVYDNRGPGIRYWGTYASGYLDGAEVRVYRIVDGQVRLARTDRVADGGTVIEHWVRADNKIIPAETTTSQFKWAPWSRPGVHRWFTVFAVDHSGNVSEPATPIRLERSEAADDAKAEENTERFKKGKSGGEDRVLPAPTGFTAVVNDQGLVEMNWDSVRADGLAGYRVAYTDTDPASHRGVYLQLVGDPDSPSEHIRQGDMIIVNKSLVDFDRGWLSHRLANLEREVRRYTPDAVPKHFYPGEVPGLDWRLAPHATDTPVTDPGEYYLEMTLRDGDTMRVGETANADLSKSTQDFYTVPEDGAEYVMEVWLKADRPDRAPVVFTWLGDETIGGFIGRNELQPTTQWKKHTVRFTGRSSDTGQHAYMVLETSGPGVFSFDNYRIYRADTPYLDLLPEDYAALEQSGMTALRTHGPIKTRMQTYSMRQFLGGAGQAEGIAKGNTLPQMLGVIENTGMHPWLQIEYHMSPEEWLAFVEYIAAPFDPAADSAEDKPYAALRHRQSRTEPWVDAFDRIYFEIANETWNRLFAPWTFDEMIDTGTGKKIPRGEVYGKFHDYVVGIMQSSPYWSAELDEKFIHVLGGWSTSLRPDSNGNVRNSGYTQEAARASNTAEYITIAAYNGGWDEGEGPPQVNPASYFNALAQVNQTAIPRARTMQTVIQRAADRGRAIRSGVYEAGPGYALNGLNNARVTRDQSEQQEQVMKSKLAGTATLDSFLARAYHGFALDNFFVFGRGTHWRSHAKLHRGGQAHASYLPLELFNHHATGDMLEVETVSTPTADLAAVRRREAVDDAPLAAVYATRDGDRVALFCLSRRVRDYPRGEGDGFTPFAVELPFSQADTVTLHRLTGDPTDTNIDRERVRVESVSLDPMVIRDGTLRIDESSGGDHRGLPPSEFYLYVFDGVR